MPRLPCGCDQGGKTPAPCACTGWPDVSAKRLPDWIHACVEALVRAYLVVGGASPAVGVVMCGGGMCGGGSGIALRYLAVRRPFLKHLVRVRVRVRVRFRVRVGVGGRGRVRVGVGVRVRVR